MNSDTTSTSKADVLIVDDAPDHLHLVSTILTKEGYQVRTATNGSAALESVESRRPDLILLDINIPELNGYEVCRQLKADDQTRDIPVIFVSALDKMLDKARAFSVGGADYMTKPFQFEEVLALVKTHLTLRLLEQQLDSRVTELQTLTTRLQNELGVARDIQQGLLPPPTPEWPDLDVICYTQPAREVGGDFYTYYTFDTRLRLNQKRFAVAVGDVSGKGMPAALLMTISLASFKTIITQAYSLNKLVTDLVTKPYSLSKFLTDLDKDIAFYTATMRQYCALVYIEITKPIDPHELTTLRAVNAGCIMPIIRRSDGSVIWVDVGGMPLGAGLGAQFGYQEKVLNLSPGDLVILVSDGVVEANNSRGQMFGFDRLEQAVVTGPQSSPKAMLEHLKAEVAAFVGLTEPHDDLTLVVIQA
jgi:serine phosphatase RsbU (regulator of sigma subunit)